jgi:type IV pilus assembly protein PilY1
VTWNGAKGVAFTWTAIASAETITEAQKTAIGSEDVLHYLRGDDSKEKSKTNGIYRDRASRLGDIVNSAPLYVKNGTDHGYGSMTTAVTISVDDQLEDTSMGAL